MQGVSKKRVLTLLLRILVIAVVLCVLAYLLFSVYRLSDKHVQSDEFGGAVFYSSDGSEKLEFSGDVQSAAFTRYGKRYSLIVEYSNGVFNLSEGDAAFVFIVIDAQALFFSEGFYFYRYR